MLRELDGVLYTAPKQKRKEELTEQEFMILQMNDFEPVKEFKLDKLTAEELKKVYIELAEELGYSEEEIFGAKRRRVTKLVYLRFYFYETLRKRGFILQEIANLSGGKSRHCTVLHSLKTCKDIICPEKRYIEQFLTDKGLL